VSQGSETSVLILILATAVTAGTPILYAALGELLAERSGVINLGVEGMMLIGAVSGFIAAVHFSRGGRLHVGRWDGGINTRIPYHYPQIEPGG